MTKAKSRKKRVRGVVDRIANGIVVVVVRHPDDPDAMQEIYIPESEFKKRVPREGDYICFQVDEKGEDNNPKLDPSY